jgi:VanZ family protein
MRDTGVIKNLPTPLLMLLILLTVAAILYFGLISKNSDQANGFQWLEGGAGIGFRRPGMAYVDLASVHGIAAEAFTIDLAFAPSQRPADGFSLVLVIHNGHDGSQLVIGQWLSWIIVMNGDDYDHRRGVPRLSFDTSVIDAERLLVTLSSGANGTALFVNGDLVGEDPNLHLKIPVSKRGRTRLVLGNSVAGRNSWRGELYGVALYNRQFEAPAGTHLYRRWLEDSSVADLRVPKPVLLLSMVSPGSAPSPSKQSEEVLLTVPERIPVLHPRVLRMPAVRSGSRIALLIDVILNLFGFVPLGFLLSHLLRRLTTLERWNCALMATLAGFALSLTVEVVQAWYPARDSSLLDLALNTLGMAAGAVAVTGWYRRNA